MYVGIHHVRTIWQLPIVSSAFNYISLHHQDSCKGKLNSLQIRFALPALKLYFIKILPKGMLFLSKSRSCRFYDSTPKFKINYISDIVGSNTKAIWCEFILYCSLCRALSAFCVAAKSTRNYLTVEKWCWWNCPANDVFYKFRGIFCKVF